MSAALVFEDRVTTNREAFTSEVKAIGARLGMDPNWLMIVMNFETGGTFSPSVKNPGSSATGLIQFVENTAGGLGTTTADLAKMSNVEQLHYVEKYYRGVIKSYGAIDSLVNAYFAVIYPAMIKYADDKALPAGVYSVNSGLDLDRNGSITKAEIASKILSTVPATMRKDVNSTKYKVMNRVVFFIGIILILAGFYLSWQFK